jgi:hypothetical protein
MPVWALDSSQRYVQRGMSDVQRNPGAVRRRASRRRAVRLGVLLGVFAGLVAYLALHGPSGGSRRASACVGQHGAPEVERVAPGKLSPLREQLARLVPQRAARLYEEGTVLAASAWTDEEPAPPAVSPTALRPAGYEMRWWAPNGDDVVADVLVFADATRAQRFLALASGTRCRARASQQGAPSPPLGRNLSWLNPDGAAQADVYFARGERVYRIADAPAGQASGPIRPGSLSRALLTIDTLACLLPGAHCSVGSKSVVPA